MHLVRPWNVTILLFLMLFALLQSVFGQDACDFEDEKVLIGSIAPLSAPGAVITGISMAWAFELAAEDINAFPRCGIQIDGMYYPVNIIMMDSKGMSEYSNEAVQSMIADNDLAGVVGVYHSAVALATMDVLQDNALPTVFSEPWNDNVSANGIISYQDNVPRFERDGIDYIFRIAPASSMTSLLSINWLLNLDVKDVVIIAENTDFGIPVAETDAQLLEAANVNVEIIPVELDTDDFAPALRQIQERATPPDAIKLQVTGEASFILTQQLAERGIAPSADTICITNQAAFQSEQYWRAVPDGNYCAFFRVGTVPALFNDQARVVNEHYSYFFRDNVPSFGLEAYDSVWLLVDAFQRAGTFTDAEKIVEALETTDIELTQGHYYFPYGQMNPVPLDEGIPAYMWHQWPDPLVTMMQYFEVGQTGLEAAVVWPELYQTHGTAYIQPGTSP